MSPQAGYPPAPPYAQAPAAYPQPALYPQAPPYGMPPQAGYPPAPPYAPAPAAYPQPQAQRDRPFVVMACWRAFRLRCGPEDVLPAERAAMQGVAPPVLDPRAQGFLAWRRSLLFVVAAALIPVSVLRAIEVFGSLDDAQATLATFSVLQLSFEVGFAALAWILFFGWANWPLNRKILLWGWVAYFVFPFLTYLFPYRELIEGAVQGEGALGKGEALLVGMIFSLQAILTLAPKAVSLMPGLLRAAMATKLLFPGSSAPGWLIVLAAPLYALLVYVVMMVPYQITGSGFFVLAMIGLLGAQAWLAVTGLALGRPLDPLEAARRVRRARRGYFWLSAGGLVFLAIGFQKLIRDLDMPPLAVANLILSFAAHVYVLTLVGTDLVVASLRRQRGDAAGGAAMAEETGRQVDAFFGGQ
jgi:hypothetical protein